MRSATAPAVLVAIACAVACPGLATASPKTLGEAHRAYRDGEYEKALRLSKKALSSRLKNRDYALFIRGQSSYMLGDFEEAASMFELLTGDQSTRFQVRARWRLADCHWNLGRHQRARDAYWDLVNKAGRRSPGDLGTARFRIALAARHAGNREEALTAFQRFLELHPRHVLEERALRHVRELAPASEQPFTARTRLTRAQRLTESKRWHLAMDELHRVGDGLSDELEVERQFWTAMTLFKMRRHYRRAGKIFLRIYPKLGERAAEALFHGARALSRADEDKKAIRWYLKLVKEYPKSKWAPEANYLAGWLWYNLGEYRKAPPILKAMRKRYPRSPFAVDALWYQGMSHYLQGNDEPALELFRQLGKRGGREIGGKGRYWEARTLDRLKRPDEANKVYRGVVRSFPFSWYALLSQARLRERSLRIGPFGESPVAGNGVPALATKVDPRIVREPAIQRVDELLRAGLGVEASFELRRAERALMRKYPNDRVLAVLMNRYRRGGNFNRPWMLAVIHGGSRALNVPAKGVARRWWKHAYPLAYKQLVERWRTAGNNPEFYLYSIMRKESGFNPHTHSYADAQGLLQMIPPTTKRVVAELDVPYYDGLLFDPELNVRTGSWYIGRLLEKFKGQIPFGAGSYNSGPGAVMKWMRKNGKRPADEFVELVSYTQTRNYMRRVTETYARYLYLYRNEVYEQPLVVDADYLENDIDY